MPLITQVEGGHTNDPPGDIVLALGLGSFRWTRSILQTLFGGSLGPLRKRQQLGCRSVALLSDLRTTRAVLTGTLPDRNHRGAGSAHLPPTRAAPPGQLLAQQPHACRLPRCCQGTAQARGGLAAPGRGDTALPTQPGSMLSAASGGWPGGGAAPAHLLSCERLNRQTQVKGCQGSR